MKWRWESRARPKESMSGSRPGGPSKPVKNGVPAETVGGAIGRPSGQGPAPEVFNDTFKFQPLAGRAQRRLYTHALNGSGSASNPSQSNGRIDGGRPNSSSPNNSPGWPALAPRFKYQLPQETLPPAGEKAAPAKEQPGTEDGGYFLDSAALDEKEPEDPAAPERADDRVEYEPAEPMETTAPRILLVDRSGRLSLEISDATAGFSPEPEILRMNGSTQLAEVVAEELPDVIIFSPEAVTGAGLKRLARIHTSHPRIVILLSEGGRQFPSAQIAASGASDIIGTRRTRVGLRAKLTKALQMSEELRGHAHTLTYPTTTPDAPTPEGMEFEVTASSEAESPAEEPADLSESDVESDPHEEPGEPAPDLQLGCVFAAASASGGAGKTFFTTNLATYLAKVTGGKVLLIDLDLQFGQVAIALHLRPSRTIAELVEEADLETTFDDYVVDHSAGFKVLCAPNDPLAAERVGPAEIALVIDAAQRRFDYVVVDTGDALNEACLALYEKAQTLVVIASMDFPSLKNVRVFLETLDKLGIAVNETPLVVNKVESDVGVELDRLEPIYPQGFSIVLPYSKAATLSRNVGVPVLQGDPHSEISRKLAEGFLKWVAPSSGLTLPWMGPQKTRRWFSTSRKGETG